MQRNIKKWKEAATVIILAKNFAQAEKWNYKILTVKRTKTMDFMPKAHTFPGGAIEKADSDQNWLKLYESFGMDQNYFNKLSKVHSAPIFKNYSDNELPRYISLRISAIRETFEECGILFCKLASSKCDDRENLPWASCVGIKIEIMFFSAGFVISLLI